MWPTFAGRMVKRGASTLEWCTVQPCIALEKSIFKAGAERNVSKFFLGRGNSCSFQARFLFLFRLILPKISLHYYVWPRCHSQDTHDLQEINGMLPIALLSTWENLAATPCITWLTSDVPSTWPPAGRQCCKNRVEGNHIWPGKMARCTTPKS